MSNGYTDNEQRWSEVEHYVEQKLIPEDSIMKQVLLSNQQADLPPFDVSPGTSDDRQQRIRWIHDRNCQ